LQNQAIHQELQNFGVLKSQTQTEIVLPAPPVADYRPMTLDAIEKEAIAAALARHDGNVATAAGYQIAESGDSLQITIPIGSLRKQTVTVDFGIADESGHAMVSCWSVCGPANEKNAMALLRYNAKMLHGAFAVRKSDGAEVLVLQANQLAETLDPLEVSRVLSAIAWQADQVEQKLGGGDEY